MAEALKEERAARALLRSNSLERLPHLLPAP
jgi:hypothetical protein